MPPKGLAAKGDNARSSGWDGGTKKGMPHSKMEVASGKVPTIEEPGRRVADSTNYKGATMTGGKKEATMDPQSINERTYSSIESVKGRGRRIKDGVFPKKG